MLLSLQASAGNRAVSVLVQRTCCRSCADRDSSSPCEQEPDEDRSEPTIAVARIADAPADTPGSPGCSTAPDPMGEWRTEPWLCKMRRSAIGDNSYLLAAKGMRGAPGDARGRSVELLHQVLAAWACERPEAIDGLTVPTSDRYSDATAAVVRAFQRAGGEPADGIVGPGTLNLLDYYLNENAPVPPMPDCTGRSETCPPREPKEEEASEADALVLRTSIRPGRGGSDVVLVDLVGFDVNGSSLEKADDAVLEKLDAALDVHNLTPVKRSAEVRCLQAERVTVYGFADCHESPALAAERAERIRDDFPEAGVLVDKSVEEPADNATAGGRRRNRAVQIQVERRLAHSLDLAGVGLDEVLGQFDRAKLTGSYDEDLIAMVELLKGGVKDDGARFLSLGGAAAVSGIGYPSRACANSDAWPWKDARKAVGEALTTTVDAEQACLGGADVGSEQLLLAVRDGLFKPMVGGVSKLVYEGARLAIASQLAGCPCVALKELWSRSHDPADIYHAIEDHSSFEGEPSGTCDS